MFEIIRNPHLPQLNVHLKVLQNLEKVVKMSQSGSNSNSPGKNGPLSETQAQNWVKFTYNSEWSLMKSDRELIKATKEGFLLHLGLTEQLKLRFLIKPKNVKFLGEGAYGYDPMAVYRSIHQKLSADQGLEVPIPNPS